MESFRKPPLQGKVLVTGAFGFIGRRLITRLIDEGNDVIAFDLPQSNIPDELNGRVQFIAGNISKESDVHKAVAQVDIIVHLAAVVGDWGPKELFQQVTIDGTRHLFTAAQQNPRQPKIILISSIVVYGDRLGQGVCSEETPHGRPFGPYSRAKQAQEHLAKEFQQKGLDIAILRLANIYGPGSKLWVDELCRELKRGTPALLNGGNFNASLTHVDNVVEMILCTAATPDSYGQTFNIADEDQVSWRTYGTALAEIIGASPPKSIPKSIANLIAVACEAIFGLLRAKRRPPLTREAVNLIGSPLHIPIDKAKRELGYQPIKDYQTSLAEIRECLASH